jgi:spore coat protein A
VTRREFVYGSLAGALLGKLSSGSQAPSILDPNHLPKFVDRLPVLPRARPSGMQISPQNTAVRIPFYRMEMQELRAKVHRDLPPTRFWGFESSFPGPTIEARSGEPLLIEWKNNLPHEHFLPIDYSLHGSSRDVPDVRTVVHLHGGRVPPESDGYPEHWFQPGGSSRNFYPNRQEATMLWYHDHAMAITRLNILAGLFGLYIVRDGAEDTNCPWSCAIVLFGAMGSFTIRFRATRKSSGFPNSLVKPSWLMASSSRIARCSRESIGFAF